MGKSLQDQFLKMGLVDKKQFQQAKKEEHGRKKGPVKEESDIAEMARQALAEKKKKDQQLNKKKIAQRQVKEDAAKARQLIETHRIAMEKGDITYNFKDDNTIKRLLLPQKTVNSLVQGKIGIVKLAGEYQLVPAATVYKIRELNSKMVVLLNSPTDKKEVDADDPYGEYVIPDDLMW